MKIAVAAWEGHVSPVFDTARQVVVYHRWGNAENGKLEKFYSTVCLIEQPFVKNTEITIKDHITAKIAQLGENIVVRRFIRWQVGEELQTAS